MRPGRRPMRSKWRPASRTAGCSAAPPSLTTAPPEHSSAVSHRAPAPGDRLRSAARTLALLGQQGRDATMASLTLIGNLAAIAVALRSCARLNRRPGGRQPPARRPNTYIQHWLTHGHGHPGSGRAALDGRGHGLRRTLLTTRLPRRHWPDSPGLRSLARPIPGQERQHRPALSGHPPGRPTPLMGHRPHRPCRRGSPRHARDHQMLEMSHGQTTIKRS
jgi:hypothetical protein